MLRSMEAPRPVGRIPAFAEASVAAATPNTLKSLAVAAMITLLTVQTVCTRPLASYDHFVAFADGQSYSTSTHPRIGHPGIGCNHRVPTSENAATIVSPRRDRPALDVVRCESTNSVSLETSPHFCIKRAS